MPLPMPVMVECLQRAIRPASKPVIRPLMVEPRTIITKIGRASGENHADKPSSAPSTAPATTPIIGLLITRGSSQDPIKRQLTTLYRC